MPLSLMKTKIIALAFDPTVFRGAEDPNDILSKAKGDKITNLRAAVNSLGFPYQNQ